MYNFPLFQFHFEPLVRNPPFKTTIELVTTLGDIDDRTLVREAQAMRVAKATKQQQDKATQAAPFGAHVVEA